MGLENEILQSKFRNNFQKAAVNIIYTYHWLNEQMKTVFSKQDITSQQFNILRILRGANKPLSTLQIRQRMLDKMSDTSRIVDRMVIKGLVMKNISPADKRMVDITISNKGQQVLQEIDKYESQMDDIMKNMTENEAETLNLLLDKLRNA
jgi:DNA-binding MarR family transcriptional regulator